MRAWERSLNPGSFLTSTQLSEQYVKWLWMPDRQFRKVTEMFGHRPLSHPDVRTLWAGEVFRSFLTIRQALLMKHTGSLKGCRSGLELMSVFTSGLTLSCANVSDNWLAGCPCCLSLLWLQGSAPKVAPLQQAGIPAAADLSFRPCPHLTLPLGLTLYNVTHRLSVVDTNTHKQIHTQTYSAVLFACKNAEMWTDQVRNPEEKSEAVWVVTVADKAEADKIYRSNCFKSF